MRNALHDCQSSLHDENAQDSDTSSGAYWAYWWICVRVALPSAWQEPGWAVRRLAAGLNAHGAWLSASVDAGHGQKSPGRAGEAAGLDRALAVRGGCRRH